MTYKLLVTSTSLIFFLYYNFKKYTKFLHKNNCCCGTFFKIF